MDLFHVSKKMILAILAISLIVLPQIAFANDGDDKENLPMPPINGGLRVSPSDFESEIQNVYPIQFSGASKIDAEIVRSIRIEMDRAGGHPFSGKGCDYAIYAEPSDVALQMASRMKEYLQIFLNRSSNPEFTNNLLQEVTGYCTRCDATLSKVYMMFLRHAASISVVTPEELELFNHAVYPGYVDAFQDRKVCETHDKTLLRLASVSHKVDGITRENLNKSYAPMISYRVKEKIRYQVEELLGPQLLFPVLGHGKFGLSTLTKAYLQELFLLGVPDKNVVAHGISLSPVTFKCHDLAHKLVDPRRNSLKDYILFMTDFHIGKIIETGNPSSKEPLPPEYSADTFSKFYTPLAVAKYCALHDALLSIYNSFLTKILPYRGQKEFDAVMAGFFWALHEEPNFPSEIFGVPDLDLVIDTLVGDYSPTLPYTQKNTEETSEVDITHDPLITSPLNGTTSMSDDEIVEYVLSHGKISDSEEVKFKEMSVFSEDAIYREDVVDSKVLKRSSRYIDVQLSLRSGDTLTFYFPTLYQKWRNADDLLGILNIAHSLYDTPLQKPDLENADSPRELAQQFLGKLEERKSIMLKHFAKYAKFFAHYAPSEEPALADNYLKTHMVLNLELIKKFPLLFQQGPAEQ
ncbi:MAG: hypothetical protein HOI80_03710 [Alphaproteobacteria bacterium]|jgi:hypothetical protein|nr:hypothetical protein [Alphaproteobacteria bacterium]MBT5389357.1 hypothetical protein [Alphaproteobacteria bacterium]MBT5540285.1 hypothetical protein [Alphaproteobacteria bacterium]MBT5654591.1 hypothetical protein [Alphaproteobacteria bacterium]